jgi:GMP synthase-like glutamine amidotransferase
MLLVQNFSNGDPGRVGEALVRRGVACTTIKSYRTDVLPVLDGFDAVAVFGSPTSCRDIGRYPELLRVRDLVRECLAIDKPVMGICYGAQLLACVAGADVRRNDTPEYGGYELRLTAEGSRHPLLAGFPESFIAAEFHEDTFNLPSGATLLTSSSACRNQAFVIGRHVGLQFHLEATPAMTTTWLRERPDLPGQAGKTIEQTERELEEALSHQAPLCELFMDNFIRLVRS